MTGQNRSSAVMQQRRKVAPGALDYFPTPPFATRALCEFLKGQGQALDQQVCWEPACGEGHMARPLREYFADVIASDVHRYSDDHELFDFTLTAMAGGQEQPDWVITNPPFRLAVEFIQAANAITRKGFAMLVRSAFLEGGERYRQLFSQLPPTFALQFSERVVMLEGRLIRAGDVDPFSDQPDRRARSATAYCWLVWLSGQSGATELHWIAPCRERLERQGDYPEYDAAAVPADEADGLFA
jgi:hypothetical protein